MADQCEPTPERYFIDLKNLSNVQSRYGNSYSIVLEATAEAFSGCCRQVDGIWYQLSHPSTGETFH